MQKLYSAPQNGSGWAISHHDKQMIISNHFTNLMACPQERTRDFNWNVLQLQNPDLTSLDDPFTEQEILHAIKQLPSDKAPGPDGFTGLFFKTYWNIIKQDVVAAVNYFHSLRCEDLNLLNKANIILIPKKEGTESIQDFRPITLIHAVAKISANYLR